MATQTAAAKALGKNGNLDAVAPMYQLQQENPKEPLRSALTTSIKNLQNHLATGQRGSLSLQEESQGQLSFTEDGKLSITNSSTKN